MNRILNRKSALLQPAAFIVVAAGIAGLAAMGGCTINAVDGSATNTCTQDASVTGCTNNSTGFSCTGVDTPSQSNAALTCGAGVAGANGDTDYCCSQQSGEACGPDSTVTGCVNGSTGYSCTGGETPPQSDTSLTCGAGVAGASAGVEDFCCSTGTQNTCAADPSVTGCQGNSSGYSCDGADTPDESDPSISCSTGTPSNGQTLYCCVTLNSSSTCSQDDSVAGCQAGSYGFSCTGSDTPEQGDPSLTCSSGTPESGDTIYCCQF